MVVVILGQFCQDKRQGVICVFAWMLYKMILHHTISILRVDRSPSNPLLDPVTAPPVPPVVNYIEKDWMEWNT